MAPAVSLPRLQPPSHPQLQRGPKYPTKKVQTPRTAVVLHLKRTWRKGALQLASFFLQEGSQPNPSPKHWQGHTQTLTQEKTSRTGGSGGSSCPPTAPPNHAARLWGAHTERAALAPGHHKKKKKKRGKRGQGRGECPPAPLPTGALGNGAAEKFGDRLQRASSELKSCSCSGQKPGSQSRISPLEGSEPRGASYVSESKAAAHGAIQATQAGRRSANKQREPKSTSGSGGGKEFSALEGGCDLGRPGKECGDVRQANRLDKLFMGNLFAPLYAWERRRGSSTEGWAGAGGSRARGNLGFGWGGMLVESLAWCLGREQQRNNGGWGCPAGKRAPAGPTPARGRHGSIGARCHSGDGQGQHPACPAASSLPPETTPAVLTTPQAVPHHPHPHPDTQSWEPPRF